MCGIFGYSIPTGVVSRFQRGILASNLARFNDDRGGHSWGLLGATKQGLVVHRGLGELAPDVSCAAPYAVMFAHTRYATQGAHTIANSHPFEIGSIVGAHNGMIYNHDDLNRRYRRRFAVDSMHLFAHLSEGREFDDLQGYGAIQWVDRDEPDKVNLARLARGELAVMGLGTPDACMGVVWSSDEDHLYEAMLLAGIDQAFEFQIDEGAGYHVKGHALYASGTRYDLTAPAAFIDWRKAGESATKADCRLWPDDSADDAPDSDLPVDDFFRMRLGL